MTWPVTISVRSRKEFDSIKQWCFQMWPTGFGSDWRFTEAGWFGDEISNVDVTWYFRIQEDAVAFEMVWR